ncbi:MAG TPA: hypothetical protein VK211_09710 [Kamptonema sp.]|nr:hypothetical protein [Kamptonema sp.]
MSENAQVLKSLVKEADVAIALKSQTAKSTSNAGWVQLASGQDF